MSFSHRILSPFLLSLSPFPFSYSLFLWKLTRPMYNICKWITVAETMVPDPEPIYPVSTYPLAVLAYMLLPWQLNWRYFEATQLYWVFYQGRAHSSINQIINYGGVVIFYNVCPCHSACLSVRIPSCGRLSSSSLCYLALQCLLLSVERRNN